MLLILNRIQILKFLPSTELKIINENPLQSNINTPLENASLMEKSHMNYMNLVFQEEFIPPSIFSFFLSF